MRPLPTTPESLPEPQPVPEQTAHTLVKATRTLELGPPPSTINQRRAACPTQRAYPWLLGISTVMAAAFCWLYISKPVIVTQAKTAAITNNHGPSAVLNASAASLSRSPILPAPSSLPGDDSSRPQAVEPQNLAQSETSKFEQTNLKIQHVLGARGPAGEDLGRLTLEIPVLYQSGGLRWTQNDVEKSRALLTRIRSYQQKSHALREEALLLISEWDNLIISSIPDAALRADSPTLPENQGVGTAEAAPLKSTEAIEIEP